MDWILGQRTQAPREGRGEPQSAGREPLNPNMSRRGNTESSAWELGPPDESPGDSRTKRRKTILTTITIAMKKSAFAAHARYIFWPEDSPSIRRKAVIVGASAVAMAVAKAMMMAFM